MNVSIPRASSSRFPPTKLSDITSGRAVLSALRKFRRCAMFVDGTTVYGSVDKELE